MKLDNGADDVVAARSGQFSLTFGDLREDALGFRASVDPDQTVGVRSSDGAFVAAALAALDGYCSDVHLLADGAEAPAGLRILTAADLGGETTEPRHLGRTTSWTVYTSGTTGAPKPIVHTLSTLSRTAVRSENAARLFWGLLYDPTRMAGLQVIVQSLLSGAGFMAPAAASTLSDRVDEMIADGVTAVSATPTLWRMILQTPPKQWELKQITLGGEIADQHVLDGLAQRFPAARIVHVFASTETGAAFSVRDGRAGFPVSYLSEAPRGVVLEIRDDILHVHSPGVSVAGADGFASTGDVVEVRGDRVLFRGRASGVVTVGGANVWPEEVEDLLRSHPDVDDAVVWAVPNALSGHLLMARIVPNAAADLERLGRRVRMWTKEHAPNTHVPAKVEVVDSIEISATGKAKRR